MIQLIYLSVTMICLTHGTRFFDHSSLATRRLIFSFTSSLERLKTLMPCSDEYIRSILITSMMIISCYWLRSSIFNFSNENFGLSNAIIVYQWHRKWRRGDLAAAVPVFVYADEKSQPVLPPRFCAFF